MNGEQIKRFASVLIVLSPLSWTATVYGESTWVLWKHSYEVWVDSNKEDHRREVSWKKVAATTAKADCDDRTSSEALAEYYALTGSGVGATLAGSRVGFDQKHTRYTHGYRSFECWPGTVDPRRPKGK